MQQAASRIIFGAEVLLLILPLSLLLLLLALLDLASPHARWDLVPMILVMLPSLVCLYFGWYLSLRFLNGGSESLQLSSRYPWLFAHLGVLLAFLGPLALTVRWGRILVIPESGELPAPIPELRALTLAVPLIIPYFHLLLERRFRAESNNRWRGP
jgi:hypothetical protein